MKTLHLKINGQVQGVGFRLQTMKFAQELGLTGWVKNQTDGSVQIVAQGDWNTLDKFLTWAKNGPKFAEVSDVKVIWEDSPQSFVGFEVRY